MVDIPKYIRLDFLLTLLGIVAVGFYAYLMLIVKVKDYGVSSLILIFGAILFFIGYYEMWGNYRREQELLGLKSEIKKIKYSKELTKLKREMERLEKSNKNLVVKLINLIFPVF